MLLTFETSQDGTGLDIFFDEEGRDELITLLSKCSMPGDHYHLMPVDEGGVPGYLVTTEPVSEKGTVIRFVTLGMPVSDTRASDHENE